jgi:hypothetical protein
MLLGEGYGEVAENQQDKDTAGERGVAEGVAEGLAHGSAVGRAKGSRVEAEGRRVEEFESSRLVQLFGVV